MTEDPSSHDGIAVAGRGQMMSALADEVIRNCRRSSVICFLTSVICL